MACYAVLHVLLYADSMLVYVTSDSKDDFLSGSNNDNQKGGKVLRMKEATSRKILRAY